MNTSACSTSMITRNDRAAPGRPSSVAGSWDNAAVDSRYCGCVVGADVRCIELLDASAGSTSTVIWSTMATIDRLGTVAGSRDAELASRGSQGVSLGQKRVAVSGSILWQA